MQKGTLTSNVNDSSIIPYIAISGTGAGNYPGCRQRGTRHIEHSVQTFKLERKRESKKGKCPIFRCSHIDSIIV
jgi:hypothetical protein